MNHHTIVDLWVGACLHPRQTIKEIVDYDPGYRMWPNIFIFTAVTVAVMAMSPELEHIGEFSWFFSAMLMPLVFLLLTYLYGWLYAWTGRWLGGGAKADAMRATVVWALPASVVSSIFSQVVAALAPHLDSYALFNAGLFSIAICIWVFSITIRMISEIQGFSILRAIANFLLAVMVTIVPFIALAIALPMFMG